MNWQHFHLVTDERPRAWNIAFLLSAILSFLPVIEWAFYDHLPAPGWSVAFLAFAAALMSVHDKITNAQKMLWLILIACFLIDEARAINKDRWDSDQKQAKQLSDQAASFATLLRNQKLGTQAEIGAGETNLKMILGEQQEQFKATLGSFGQGQRSEQLAFARVLEQQQQLYKHQEEVAEGETGILKPGNSPTPETVCGHSPAKALMLLWAGNAAWNTERSHVIITQHHKPVLSYERLDDGRVALKFDLRADDGQIIARMNSDGYVINRNLALQIKKTDSTLEVIDLHGDDVLEVDYLNPLAISFSTSKELAPHLHITNTCFGGSIRPEIAL